MLRLEDIDGERCRPEFAAAIQQDLAWLGIGWDGPVRVQSAHANVHRAALERLRPLLYPCFCTRADIGAAGAPQGPEGPVYPGTCRRLSAAQRSRRLDAGERHAWRLDIGRAHTAALTFTDRKRGTLRCEPEALGDVVLARKDSGLAYHLCVVCDDAAQGVTLVTRGEDLLPATSTHRLLQNLLGLPEPLYEHHRLILGPDGKRLAKRDRPQTLHALREAGADPAALLRGLA